MWKNHFEKLLNAGQPSEGERVLRGQVKQNNSLLNEDLTMQEVMWALGILKRKAAPGRDGLTAEMISKEVLLLVWYELFKLCWKEGMILGFSPIQGNVHDSERKTCLGSGRVKIGCRRAGGFRKGRGCRDQIMTLM